jgi:hypothetical protein
MLKQMKKTLGILLVVCFLMSVTAVAVSAPNPQPEPPLNKHEIGQHTGGQQLGGQFQGKKYQGEHNFRNWHDHHHHHGHHDHYYGGTYYQDYEWVYNPTTLVWDWTYMPGVVVEQPAVEQPVEVVTTPAVIDYEYGYGYGGHYDHGHHRYSDHDRHHNDLHRERRLM